MKIKPNHINMTQIMKKFFNSLFVTLLVLAGLIISPTTVFAQPEPSCVCATCGRPCDKISTLGHKPGYSCYVAKKPTPDSTYSGGGQNMQMQMMQSVLQPALNALFASLFAPPDTSAQDKIARQNAIKRQQEEEQKKQAAIQAWIELQNKEALQRKMEQNAKIEQGKKLLSKTKTVGSGDELKPFSFGNPKLDIKPIRQDTYPTAKFTEWQRLLCAAYFSNMAKQSTKDVDGRFYADQAQRVMSGEPTYIECRIPQVSNEKIAKRMEEVKKLYDEMNVKIKDFQDIEGKLIETREKTKTAELKKEEATTKLNELQNRAATVKPEEKAEIDELIRLAQEQSQNADQLVNQAKQSEKDALNKKEQLENELGNMKAQVQAKIQAGDK